MRLCLGCARLDRENIRAGKAQKHQPRFRDAVTAPLGNRRWLNIAESSCLGRAAEKVDDGVWVELGRHASILGIPKKLRKSYFEAYLRRKHLGFGNGKVEITFKTSQRGKGPE